MYQQLPQDQQLIVWLQTLLHQLLMQLLHQEFLQQVPQQLLLKLLGMRSLSWRNWLRTEQQKIKKQTNKLRGAGRRWRS